MNDLVARAPDGSQLVGSAISMPQAVERLIEHVGLTRQQALQLTAHNPRMVMGYDVEDDVGIAGLGRSGWDIHARTLEELESKYWIVAVTDSRPDRCQEAIQQLGCRAHSDFPALLGNGEVELVVIATPSHVHASQSITALELGKHVLCEKPMALSVADADRMIEAAQRAGRVLTVFNNMRYWPDFLKVREVIESGRLGRIVQIKITLHRFARRWD